MLLSPQQASCCLLLSPHSPACHLSSTISTQPHHSRAAATQTQQRSLKPWTLLFSRVRKRWWQGIALMGMQHKQASA